MAEKITFDLTSDQVQAIEALAGERKARLSGEVIEGKIVIDSVSFADKDFSKASFHPINAPFATAAAA